MLLVPDECVIVVDNALSNPFVVISLGNVESPASAPVESDVSAMKFSPTPPADVLV